MLSVILWNGESAYNRQKGCLRCVTKNYEKICANNPNAVILQTVLKKILFTLYEENTVYTLGTHHVCVCQCR